MKKIGLGGGCYWCMEAVFQSLKGVAKVEQGFISSFGEHSSFSEAVVVHFDCTLLSLRDVLKIHLSTHKSTSEHSMRSKYRSAVYTFSEDQRLDVQELLTSLQASFEQPLITKVLPFQEFKLSEAQFLNYYYKNPKKPFCQNYIEPKLKQLLNHFFDAVNHKKLTSVKPLHTTSA